jgi:hypothetical protein
MNTPQILKRRVPVLSIGAALISLLIACVAFSAPPEPPPSKGNPFGSVAFLGYTNDASGTRLARFAVTNLNASAVTRSHKCLIWAAQSGTLFTPQWRPQSAFLFPESRVLGAGASEIVTVPPPTNPSPWRISLYLERVYNDGSTNTMQIDSGRIESQR